MARRRKTRKKGESAESVAWASYRPNESKYWFYGGPWVHPDGIEPASGYPPESMRPHEKPLTRLKSVTQIMEDAEKDLADSLAEYHALHEKGVGGLKWPWMREKIEKGEHDPNEPNHLHYAFCQCYGSIARLRAQIAACQAVIEGIEPARNPLFYWKQG